MWPLASDIVAGKEISRDEKQLELALLLRSGLVREHTCLHALLSYFGSRSFENGGGPLKEYTIGVEALGKPADYDPRVDPTVRVDIGKLRGKLKDYYEKQGAQSAVRVEIPRGHYHLVYSRASRERRRPGTTLLALAGAAVIAVLGVGLGLGWNFCYVAGSALLQDQLRPSERATTQGFNDLLIGIAAAFGAVASGLIFAAIGYAVMGLVTAGAALLPLLLALRTKKAAGPKAGGLTKLEAES